MFLIELFAFSEEAKSIEGRRSYLQNISKLRVSTCNVL
jgi:hypothetical protein